MASGKIKWFDNKRGFGFILQDSGQDIFVHHKSIEGDGFKTLGEGDVVTYEVIQSERGPKAHRVQRVQRAQIERPFPPVQQRKPHRSIRSYLRNLLR
jgi:CspA family cold shock protein